MLKVILFIITFSKEHLPIPFQKLMTDKDSEIIDFYPEEFKIDLNGKKYAWQGIVYIYCIFYSYD
jgi:5'-3' exoribonuclease 2